MSGRVRLPLNNLRILDGDKEVESKILYVYDGERNTTSNLVEVRITLDGRVEEVRSLDERVCTVKSFTVIENSLIIQVKSNVSGDLLTNPLLQEKLQSKKDENFIEIRNLLEEMKLISNQIENIFSRSSLSFFVPSSSSSSPISSSPSSPSQLDDNYSNFTNFQFHKIDFKPLPPPSINPQINKSIAFDFKPINASLHQISRTSESEREKRKENNSNSSSTSSSSKGRKRSVSELHLNKNYTPERVVDNNNYSNTPPLLSQKNNLSNNNLNLYNNNNNNNNNNIINENNFYSDQKPSILINDQFRRNATLPPHNRPEKHVNIISPTPKRMEDNKLLKTQDAQININNYIVPETTVDRKRNISPYKNDVPLSSSPKPKFLINQNSTIFEDYL